MMAWTILILLIAIGLGLVVIEIIFVPGTTIVGIMGLLCIFAGLGYGFSEFGHPMGWGITAVTTLVSAVVIIISLRSGVWNKFALKGAINSKVNEHKQLDVQVGQSGTAISALKPIGNAEFKHQIWEVTTQGEHIDAGSPVKVIKTKGRIIYVEQIT